MTPREYVESQRLGTSLRGVLTPQQLLESSEVLDSGFRFIAKTVGEQYEQVTPNVAKSVDALTTMLVVFIQHAVNPEMLRRAVAQLDG